MNKYIAVIGIEMHIQMDTCSKMFSYAPVSKGKEANSCVGLYDFAFPGTLPTVNKQAVINAIRVANALNMSIDDTIMFERKNYFYSDLPKGYQLTQQFRPLGKDGYLLVGDKKIEIERLHIEEDTCKQLHDLDYSLLDYNRAGIPLVEIVTKPRSYSKEEVAKYVEKIRSIVSFLCVSSGRMEEGSLRCDVNVSLMKRGENKFGTKVEIKNLNSISNIKKAIEFEISRQSKLLDEGKTIVQETRRFNEKSKKTASMRVKIDEVDYKFFTEPNIPHIKLSKEFIEETIKSSPELAEAKMKRYMSLGLNEYDSALLTSSIEISKYFEEVISYNTNPKAIANCINVLILSYLNKNDITIDELSIRPKRLAQLIKLVESNKISIKQAKAIFATMIDSDLEPEEIMSKSNINQNSDVESLTKVVRQVLDDNPEAIKDYKNGYDKALGFLMGQVMKLTNGNANPQIANKILIEEIQRR